MSRKVLYIILVVDCYLQLTDLTQDAPAGETSGGITWAKTDYKDKEQLAQILQGTHTLLSFIGDEPTAPVQKNLIDAAVQAGVKRFAPSEWAS